MARIKNDGYPGSIFVDKRTNNLCVRFKGKQHYTGLKDSPINRKVALEFLKNLYNEFMGITKKNVSKPTIYQCFETFLNIHCNNKMPTTIVGYKIAFKTIITNDFEINENIIEDKIIYFLKNNKLSNTSINIYLRALQVFLNFCSEREIIKTMRILKNFKCKEIPKLVQTYSDEEINKLLDYFNKVDIEFSYLIQLMLLTGARIGECLQLKWEQITIKAIYFKNKIDKKNEFIPMTSELEKLINKIKRSNDKVFRWSPMTASRLTRKLSLGMLACGVEKNKRCFHEFRKTYREKLFDAGVPLEIVKDLMRHRNISVTIDNYTKYNTPKNKEYLENIKAG